MNVNIFAVNMLQLMQARWVISLYDYLRNQQDLIMQAFELVGKQDSLSIELKNENPFIDLLYLLFQ